ACKALASIYEDRDAFAELADVLRKRVRLESDHDIRRQIHLQVGQICEEQLEKPGDAIEAYRAQLDDDPRDGEALRALERLYEQTESWKDLVEVLRQIEGEAEDGVERRRCMVKVAELLSDEIDDRTEGIAAWRGVLDDFGPDGAVLGALVDLYELAEAWNEVAETIEVWLDLSEDEDERIELLTSLGDVRLNRLDEPDGALAAFREVLSGESDNEGVRQSMAELLSHEDADIKRRAAEILGPLYEADGDAEKLLKVREIEVDCTEDPALKLAVLREMLHTAEEVAESDERAFAYACRGVREAVEEESLADWIEQAERLAGSTNSWDELVVLYESTVDDILDSEVQQSLRIAAAELARDQLEDSERAVRLFEAALDSEGDDRRAMEALEVLYEAAEDHEALLRVLRRLAEGAGDRDRASLLGQIATLQAGPLERPSDAIDTYEELLDLTMSEEAAGELEGLYRAAGRHDAVASLLERQLDDAVGLAQLELRIRFAKLLLDKLDDTPRALDELAEVLESDRDNEDAIAVIEKVLATSSEADARAMVAEMLEPVYLRAGSWEKLQHVLAARIASCQDPDERGQLLRRLGTLYEEQLEDYSAAIDTVASLLQHDPGDATLWREVERLGPLTGDDYERRVAEIFVAALEEVGADDPETAGMCRRTAELFDIVDDKAQALKWYGRAFEFDQDSDELFGGIDELLTELGRHEERVVHYRTAIDRSLDDDFRVAALGIIAEIQRDELENLDGAIDTFREVLDVDPSEPGTLDALTELYKKQKRREDLIDLYSHRSEQCDDPIEAAPHQLNLARLLAKDVDARDEALDQWQVIVDAQPDHAEAIDDLEGMLEEEEQTDRKQRIIDMLRPLFEQAGDWKGLVEVNEVAVTLLESPEDKLDLLNQTARLWEAEGEDEKRAFAVLREAFQLVPEDEATREEFQRLADEVDGWSVVAKSYTKVLETLDDPAVKRELLFTLAAVHDELLDDPRAALKALSELTTLAPDDVESLERMETLCSLLSDWRALTEVLEKKADVAINEEESATMWQRIGSIRSDMLEDRESAIAAFTPALEHDPNAVLAVDRLIALHREPGQQARLVVLLEQRVDINAADAEGRREFILEAAACHEVLDQPSDAIRMLRLALHDHADDIAVLKKLEGLYRIDNREDELLENLKMQASVSSDADERLALRNKIGDLYLSKFDNSFDALEQYRLVLEEKNDDAHALGAVKRIAADHEEQRLEVAELLEPLLSELGRFDELLQTMKWRLSAQSGATERVQTLRGMALVAEEQLDDPEQARDFLISALAVSPDSDAIHDDVARLCELIEDFRPYAEALQRVATDTYDALLQSELYERLGIIAEEELEDSAMAIDAYRKAIEQTEEPNEVLAALDGLYVAAEDHEQLAEILERRAEVETDDKVIAEIGFRLAVVRIDVFSDQEDRKSV
ncbi:MAG: hypothetical protein VB934_16430, partial [Polyangiaceae bacterium]